MSLLSRPRRVLVMPAKPAADLADMVQRAQREGTGVLVLSLGHPPSPAQREMANRALELGFEHRVPVEVRTVTTVEEAKVHTRHAREVRVAASGAEAHRLEAALLPDHPELPGVARWKTSDETSGSGRQELASQDPGSESIETLTGRGSPYPSTRSTLTAENAAATKKARFRVYLGAAPGVGKTFAMLGEGQRRRSRGTDVVVGFVETYGRPMTTEMLTGLEVVPRRRIKYGNAWFDEMDTEAIIDRKPQVVLVDELAHTNVPGSRRVKRWEDALDLLASGIETVTTVNVQHLESLNDVIAKIIGIRQGETVPDWVIDLADQVELVDMSPETLRRRMAHGNIYPDAEKSELALRRFFTLENLTALRELALLRVANRVDSELLERWSRGLAPETRERVLVCLPEPDKWSADLVRRGARIAQRVSGDLLVLHVRTEESGDVQSLEEIEDMINSLGGELHVIEAESISKGIIDFATEHHVTQCVVGEPLQSKWKELTRGSVVSKLIRQSSQIDIHVIARRQR